MNTSSCRPYRYSIPAVLDPFFIWLESTAFSVWMRESPSLFAFPLILAAHTIGLGLLAGVDVAHDLRILGAAPKIPLEFDRYLPIMWLGLGVNAASGLALLIGYPTKALTNPVFYLKLGLIAVALVLVNVIRRRQHESPVPRMLAVISLFCWAGAIVAGRLLAYTYSRLDATS